MADEYIDKVEVGAKIQMMYIRREMDYGGENDFCRGMRKALRVIENMPAADVKLVISGDNCIVCGHDVRKDNVYYDVNGGTICESCMNTKCKCKNGRRY